MMERHGEWLYEERCARGWSVPEMRRRLRQAAEESGDKKLPADSSLKVMMHRWEGNRSGISQRYRLHYSRVLGIPYEAFGKIPAESQKPPGPAEPPSAETPLMLAEAAQNVLNALIAALRNGEVNRQ